MARHTHPGLEIGDVEDGKAGVSLQGQARPTLANGGGLFVLGGAPRGVRNTGPGELAILSTYVAERSEPLVTPDPR